MQKSFDVRHPRVDEYESLKQLWLRCFDDSPAVVEHFFENAVTPENVVAVFRDKDAVSVLYMVESTIKNNGVKYRALYIYAVCTDPRFRGLGLMKKCFDFLFGVSKERGTDYLFLVPADESLFEMYENLGFKKGFFCCQRKIYSKDFVSESIDYEELNFEDYINIREEFSGNITLATLDEKGFKGFISPYSEAVKTVKCDDSYAIYEIEDNSVTIHELFGDEERILQTIFNLTKAETLVFRSVADGCDYEPFGMYYTLSDSPQIERGFFGIPYGG